MLILFDFSNSKIIIHYVWIFHSIHGGQIIKRISGSSLTSPDPLNQMLFPLSPSVLSSPAMVTMICICRRLLSSISL